MYNRSDSVGIFDPSWEMLDPHPDIHALFVQFNERFFRNRLESVQLMWSYRMTSCAGICYFHHRNRECIIRLSAPLLKFRTRKNLIETLLHEMIHAYLYVTNNRLDREDHGPEFCSHMDAINREIGSDITIYHSFHDETDLYKVHVWKCDGPCRLVSPYFGTIKRSMNRAPGKNDHWWEEHQKTCSGIFTKVAGPKTRAELKEEARVLKALNHGSKRPIQGNQGLGRQKPVMGQEQSGIRKYLLFPDAASTFDVKRARGMGFDENKLQTSNSEKAGPCSTITSGALLAEAKEVLGENDRAKYEKLGAIPKHIRWDRHLAPQTSLPMDVVDRDAIVGDGDKKIEVRKKTRFVMGYTSDDGYHLSGASRLIPFQSDGPVPGIGGTVANVFSQETNETQYAECPVCATRVPFFDVNDHLDGHYTRTVMTNPEPVMAKCVVCEIKMPEHLLIEHQKQCLDQITGDVSPDDLGNCFWRAQESVHTDILRPSESKVCPSAGVAGNIQNLFEVNRQSLESVACATSYNPEKPSYSGTKGYLGFPEGDIDPWGNKATYLASGGTELGRQEDVLAGGGCRLGSEGGRLGGEFLPLDSWGNSSGSAVGAVGDPPKGTAGRHGGPTAGQFGKSSRGDGSEDVPGEESCVQCPICELTVKAIEINDHLDQCVSY